MPYKALFSVVFALFLASCGKDPKNDIPHIEPQCLASQSQCTVATPIGDVEVLFDRAKVLTEVSFSVILVNKSQYQWVSAQGFLEGKSMYMGKVPVIFKKHDRGFTAQTLLGSCSEDQMVWILWLNIEYKVSNDDIVKAINFPIEFTSYRY